MSFGSGYSAAVLADAPLGYWQLGEAEGYAQAVLADNPVGYWRLGDRESYAQAVLRDGAIGFWRLDEASGATGADSSGNGRTVNYIAPITYGAAGVLSTGTTGVTFPGGQTGNTGYASITGTANVAIGTGPMSFECWVRTTAPGPTVHFIADNKVGSSNNPGFGLSVSTSGLVTFALGNGSAYFETTTPNGSPVVSDGQWHHVVIVLERLYDAVHDRARTYVDGVLQRSIDVTAAGWNLTSPIAIFLGRFATVANPTGFDLNGSLDEVAWYQTALNAAQVANHYALRLSTRTATTALILTDTTPAVRNGTYNGGVTLAQPSVLADGTTAARFDGVSSFGFIASSAPLQIVGDLTLEVWVNITSLATRQTVCSKGASTEFELTIETSGGVSFYNANESVNASAGTVTAGAWYHIVVTRVVATKSLAIYVNGVSVKTGNYTLVVGSGGSGVQIGRTTSSTQYANGLIDEVALYNYTLTAQQIANHYALRLSTVGAATGYAAGVLADAATGFWRLGEAAGAATVANVAGTGQTGTVQGTVTLGQPTSFPDGTTGALFDGVTGYVNVLDTPAQNPGLGSYSYELWFKRAAGIAASEFLVAKANGGGNNGQGGELFMNSSGALSSRLTAKTVSSSTTVNYADGQWHHVVVSMNRAIPNGGQIYVDGIASGPAVDLTSEAAADLSGSSLDLLIGRRPAGNLFTGSIKDVSFYKSALTAGAVAAHYARGISALVALDSSANGRTGTYAGGVTLGQAGAVPVDPAALFDSVTGEVRIGTYTLPASFSVEAFFKTTDAANQKAIFTSRETPAVPNSIHVGLNTGHPRLFIDSGTDVQVATSNVADGAYHHLVVTNNGTTTTFYVDGAQVQQTAQAHAASTSAWRIGRDATGSTFFWPGTLDDVAVYSTVLTPTQVATHYAARLAGVPPGSSSSDSEEEDEIYDRLRGFYGSISGSYFVLAADTGTITLVPAVPKHTHFVQRLEVQITTPLAGAVWTLQDGAGAPIAVAPFPASAVGHYVIDLGPQGVPCTEATSLVLSISGGGSGAVGWVAWEGFKQLTLGAAA